MQNLQQTVANLDFTQSSVGAQQLITGFLNDILTEYAADQIANPTQGGLASLTTLVTSLQTTLQAATQTATPPSDAQTAQ